MTEVGITEAAAPDLAAAQAAPRPASAAGQVTGGAAPRELAADYDRAQPANRGPGPPGTRGWWRAWLARFGLAEVCGTIGAIAGFAAGYLPTGSLLTAAGLATVCEVIAFYGCIGTKTAVAAWQATAHLARAATASTAPARRMGSHSRRSLMGGPSSRSGVRGSGTRSW